MKSNPPNPSYVYLKIFLIIFSLLTVGTVITRSYHLFRNKTYDERFYSVALIGESDTEIVTMTRNNTKTNVSKLHIQNTEKSLQGKTLFEKSIILGIPLSASVDSEMSSNELFSLPNTLAHLFGKREVASQRIGDIDYFYLYLATKNVSEKEIVEKKVLFNDIVEKLVDPVELYELFRSDEIVNQKLSISVINSSGVSGAARRVADMLEMSGYYVISVESAELEESTRVEKSNDDQFLFTYLFTAEPKVVEKDRLEDIKIIIGKNAFGDL